MVSSLLYVMSGTPDYAHVSGWRSENIGALKTILCGRGAFNAIRQEVIDAIDVGAAFGPS